MTGPIMPSMDMLRAEGDGFVTAGIPQGLRDDLDRANAVRAWEEGNKRKRERIERLMAEIAEHEARIDTLRKEAAAAMWDYAGIPAPTPTPAA